MMFVTWGKSPLRGYNGAMAKKAFVVDDSLVSLEAVAKMLSLMDVEAVKCPGPREALERLAKEVPDFMVLDVNMPGVSGLEVLGYIRRDPRTADMPIIVLSSDSQPIDRERAIAAGANIFLAKPVSFEELELAINDALGEI